MGGTERVVAYCDAKPCVHRKGWRKSFAFPLCNVLDFFFSLLEKVAHSRQSLPVINSRRIPGIISGVEGPRKPIHWMHQQFRFKKLFPLIMMLQSRFFVRRNVPLGLWKTYIGKFPAFLGMGTTLDDNRWLDHRSTKFTRKWWADELGRQGLLCLVSPGWLHCCSSDRCQQGGSVAKLFKDHLNFMRTFKIFKSPLPRWCLCVWSSFSV